MPKQTGPTLTQRVNDHDERFTRCDEKRAELDDRISRLERLTGVGTPPPDFAVPALPVPSSTQPVQVEPVVEAEQGP